MSANRPVVFVLLALAVAAVVWLLTSSDPEAGVGGPDRGNSVPSAAPAAPGADAAIAATAAERLRVEAPAGPGNAGAAAADATLRVSAVWPDSRPAAGVEIYLLPGEYAQGYEPFARGTTDAGGVALFRAVPLGTIRLASDRDGQATAEISPGENEFRFELEGGVAVHGTVVDAAGGPVAGATIWLQRASMAWWGGRALGVADAAGAFAFEQLPAGASLGAFAAGFGPSALVDLDLVDTSRPPVEVTLQLTATGSSLLGRVTNAAGEAIPGAIVAAGARPTRLDHVGRRRVEVWTARHAESDDGGRFAIVGLKTGAMPVTVRALGYGIWRGVATIADTAPTTIAVELQKSATIHGRVTDSAGAAVAAATIRAYDRAPGTTFLAGGQIDFDEEFGHAGAVSDADGRFRLDGVTAGTVHVFAQEKSERRAEGRTLVWVQEVLEVAPGSDVTWNPVLDEGRTVSGIVLYRDGFPFPGLFVTLTDEKTGAAQTFDTGRSAEFRFCCLGDSTYALRVQVWLPQGGAGFVSREGLVPDQGRVEVRAEFDKPVEQKPAVVIGRIDDRAGRIRNPSAASITLHIGTNSWRDGGKLVDGAFRLEDVEPGRHRVSLVEGTTVIVCSDWFEVAPASTTDAGVLVTEPGGALRIGVDRGPNGAELEPTLALRRDGDPGTGSYQIPLGRANEYLAENLTPGDYDVTCFGSGLKSDKVRATVVAGATGAATVQVRRCALARLKVWWPGGHEGSKRWRYRVTGEDGALLVERDGDYRADIRPYPAVIAATPGRWHVEYTTDDGLRGTTDFTIGADYVDVEGRIDLARQ